ncbi:MAG: histidine phosphatase family protein [Gammaproteobacteria bacterium]|nr:histidine phosphatase family protein [Gammaproteobacteria bacterium]MDH5692720.1 histidine phosphatase family protein [Gammaproteobacteria bacterium]
MKEKILDVIRHGEPVGGKRYRGQIDDPLSDKGWKQMFDAVGDYNNWDIIYSSPLVRCQAFASELAKTLGLELVIDNRFKEIGFGEWEGKTAVEIAQSDAEKIQRFWMFPDENRPQNAESLLDFQKRIFSGFENILNNEKSERVLLVAHAGVIRMMLAYVLKMELGAVFRTEVANASITRFRISNTENGWLPRLVSHGATLK